MSRSRRLASLLLVASLCFAVAGVASVSRAANAATTTWDKRVLPIAREVEKLRGLQFEHPVPVDFLSNAAFNKSVAVSRDSLSADDKAQLQRAQSQLRSIGLLGDDVDLIDSISALQTSGALAKYDPKKKRATVRGKKIGVATKVTLAHELTHALQDQHFDLTKLQRDAKRTHSSDALQALLEGDARRVQLLYVGQLSKAQQAEYEDFQASGSAQALADTRAQGVPDALNVLFQAPYTLGLLMLEVVQAVNGETAIDGLFRDPPKADASFLTPLTLVDGTKFATVAAPALSDGERAVGKPDVFGAFALYLMLSARADPVGALAAADGWAGDGMVTFERGDKTCIRVAFAGHTESDTSRIGDAVQAWAAAGPAGAASVTAGSSRPTLTACDPGGAVGTGPDGSLAALTVATIRNQLLGSLAKQGSGVKVASCTANGVIADPAFKPLLDAAVADPNAVPDASVVDRFQQSVLTIASECQRK
jgi:hypothetical protein